MKTQDLIELAGSMEKVLTRLGAVQRTSEGGLIVPKPDYSELFGRLQKMSADPKGDDIFFLAGELEDLGNELKGLLDSDVHL